MCRHQYIGPRYFSSVDCSSADQSGAGAGVGALLAQVQPSPSAKARRHPFSALPGQSGQSVSPVRPSPTRRLCSRRFSVLVSVRRLSAAPTTPRHTIEVDVDIEKVRFAQTDRRAELFFTAFLSLLSQWSPTRY